MRNTKKQPTIVDGKCTAHPGAKIIQICAVCMGQRSGHASSSAKARSSRRNGRLGGRPPAHADGCDVQVTGRYTEDCPRCEYDKIRDAERTFHSPSDSPQ